MELSLHVLAVILRLADCQCRMVVHHYTVVTLTHCRRELRLVTAYHLTLFKMADNHHYDINFEASSYSQ